MKKTILFSLVITSFFFGCSDKDLSAECKAEADALKIRVKKGDITVIKDLEKWRKKCPNQNEIPLGDLKPNPSDDGNFLEDAKH